MSTSQPGLARPQAMLPPKLLAQLPPMLRWLHATQAALYTLIGAYLAAGWSGVASLPALQAALVVWLVVLYGFVVNDYFDVEIDRLSKPERPIPAGLTTPQVAVALALALALGAMVWSGTLGLVPAGVALVNLLVCAAYSARLKNTILIGNATMALLDATIVLYGSLALGTPPRSAWLAAGLFLLFFFGYEILKTIDDWEGDARSGLRTVATRLGPRASAALFQAIAAGFCLAALGLWLAGLASGLFLGAFLLCCGLPTLGAALAVQSARPEQVAQGLRLLRLVWLTSWLPIALLR